MHKFPLEPTLVVGDHAYSPNFEVAMSVDVEVRSKDRTRRTLT